MEWSRKGRVLRSSAKFGIAVATLLTLALTAATVWSAGRPAGSVSSRPGGRGELPPASASCLPPQPGIPPPQNALPPTASFSASPNPDEPSQPIAFDATASKDPDGTIAAYCWSFGDGATAEGSTASHAYSGVGTYSAKLQVVDNDGLSAEATNPVVVKNAAAGQSSSYTLSFNVSDRTPAKRQLVRLTGTLLPGAAGLRVTVERRTQSGSYRTVTSAALQAGRDGVWRYARRLRLKRGGKFRARVRVAGAEVRSRQIRVRLH